MNKETILVDMDAVLVNIVNYWLEQINYKHETSYTIEDIKDFSLHDCLNLPESIYSILDEPGFFFRGTPIEDSQEILFLLTKKYNVKIVTAASYSNNAVREKWLWTQKHLPFISKEQVVFTKDKTIVKGDYLIDDAPHNLLTTCSIPVIFDYPWNRNIIIKRGIRIKDWKEIGKLFGVLNE